MRAPAPVLLGLALAACGETSSDRPPGDPAASGRAAPGPPAYALTVPARFASTSEVLTVAAFAGGQVTAANELVYGLAEGYPARVTVTARAGYVMPGECLSGSGLVSWTSIEQRAGTAAAVALVEGALSVDLRDEGDVTVVLAGALSGQKCPAADGSTLTTVPLRQTVTLRVKRVAGYLVEHLPHQDRDGCEQSVVVASGGRLRSPTARPVDGAGEPFLAHNAPAPAAITLRSSGELGFHGLQGDMLTAGVGQVAVSVDTALPVRGLSRFEVVGPAALSALDVTFELRRATLKGPMLTPIDQDSSYPVFSPDEANGVVLRQGDATTTHGPLCSDVPAAWFASASSTPAACEAAVAAVADEATGRVPVAALRAPGECRLEATVPGTGLRWETRFRTTE